MNDALLTNGLQIVVRLAAESMTNGKDLDFVRRARIKIFQDNVRLRSQRGHTFPGVVSIVGDFELFLFRINVALPGDIQTLLDGLQILDYRTGGTRRLIQNGLV